MHQGSTNGSSWENGAQQKQIVHLLSMDTTREHVTMGHIPTQTLLADVME
jgi:hypothetical protein